MASYSKLRDGSWGLRGKDLVAGATITVTKKSGGTKVETVGRILWRGEDGTCLASIEASQPAGRTRDGRVDCRKYGWDGVVGSSSYYTSGQYDEDS